MEIYKKIKSFAITVYRDLNNNNLSTEQKKKDKELFFKWWNYFVNVLYIVYGLFSIVSIYFFTTRVIL